MVKNIKSLRNTFWTKKLAYIIRMKNKNSIDLRSRGIRKTNKSTTQQYQILSFRCYIRKELGGIM